MAEPEELDRLAEHYLELFEEEHSRWPGDPDLAEALDQLSEAWMQAARTGWMLTSRGWSNPAPGTPKK